MKKTIKHIFALLIIVSLYSCSKSDISVNPEREVFQEPVTVIKGKFNSWQYGDSVNLYMGAYLRDPNNFVWVQFNQSGVNPDGSFDFKLDLPPSGTFARIKDAEASPGITVSDSNANWVLVDFLRLGPKGMTIGALNGTDYYADCSIEPKEIPDSGDAVVYKVSWVYVDRPISITGKTLTGFHVDTTVCNMYLSKGWNRRVGVIHYYYKKNYATEEIHIDNNLSSDWNVKPVPPTGY